MESEEEETEDPPSLDKDFVAKTSSAGKNLENVE